MYFLAKFQKIIIPVESCCFFFGGGGILGPPCKGPPPPLDLGDQVVTIFVGGNSLTNAARGLAIRRSELCELLVQGAARFLAPKKTGL